MFRIPSEFAAMTQKEIAKRLGLDVKTVQKIQRQAFKKIVRSNSREEVAAWIRAIAKYKKGER